MIKFFKIIWVSICLISLVSTSGDANTDIETINNLHDIKSILKKNSASPVKKTVSFSSDTKNFDASKSLSFKDLKGSIKHIYKNDPRRIIFAEAPFDYEIEEDGQFMDSLQLPFKYLELISRNYPGLVKVPVTNGDRIGLVIFAAIHDYESKIIESSFLTELSAALDGFDFESELFHLLRQFLSPRQQPLTKIKALEELLIISMRSKCYYTVEAIYEVFGRGCHKIFFKESIKSRDMKLFNRFNVRDHDFSPDKIVSWAIQYANVSVYLEFIDLISDIERVAQIFRSSIIIYISKCPFHFPGLVDKVAVIEKNDFDEAIWNVIERRNELLFKEMIKYDNFTCLDNVALEAFRMIFNDMNASFVFLVEDFNSKEEFEKVFKTILFLQSKTDNVLRTFSLNIPEMIKYNLDKKLLKLSLFFEDRNYMKMLLDSRGDGAFVVDVTEGSYEGVLGVWEYIYGAKTYLDITNDFLLCQNFNILHAIANPDFPAALWSSVLRLFSPYVSGSTYNDLSKITGFNFDSELFEFNLESKTDWSLLELAILNFNPTAVDELLKAYRYFDTKSALRLAEWLKIWVSVDGYVQQTFHPRLTAKVRILKYARQCHPNFFSTDSHPLTVEYFVAKIRRDIDRIVMKLKEKS